MYMNALPYCTKEQTSGHASEAAMAEISILNKRIAGYADDIHSSNAQRFHAEELLRAAGLYSKRLRP